MSEMLVTEVAKKPVRQRKARPSEIDECRTWLGNLNMQSAPRIHINGVFYPTAIVVIDFGTPLNEPVKLSPEQVAEMINHIRIITKSLLNERDMSVRVQSDTMTGIWWSSVG